LIKNLIFSICCIWILNSCAPKISTGIIKTYTPIDYREDIRVFGLKEPIPKNSEELGIVKIGDTGFSNNRGWDFVIDQSRMEARKIGGNAIKITNHLLPGEGFSQCHRITAIILKIDYFDGNVTESDIDSSLNNLRIAILHVYRPDGPSLVNYDLHLDDSVLCRITNNMEQSVIIRQEGTDTLWAQTEVIFELPLDIKFGREYFIRCGISTGAFIGHPKIELIDNQTGRKELQSVKMNFQDKSNILILNDGNSLECLVTDVNDKYVSYKIFQDSKEFQKQIEKSKVERILSNE
jgi:hypothetical protein